VLRLIRRRVPPGPRRYELRRWLGTALPVALVDGTEILLLNMDVLLVGLFLPPPSVAAYYAATRLTQMLDLVRYAASAATAQRFAALFALGRAEDVVRLARRATLATAALCGAGAITLSLLAGPLLGLFGSGFAAAAPVVPIAAAGLVLAALCGPGEDLLTMTGGERVCAAVHAVALPLTLLLALVLIPTLGIVGAALATATALVGRSAALAWLAWRRLGALPVGSGRAG
jgi:O-antigen/teichoic acid export membrane protein